jgi:hypothetical protein
MWGVTFNNLSGKKNVDVDASSILDIDDKNKVASNFQCILP